MARKVRIGLAGLGRMGRVHATNLASRCGEAFARCVRDGEPPRVTGADALAAFDRALAADRSWREGRAVRLTPRRTEDGVAYEIEGG